MKRRMAILLAAVTFLSASACADRFSGQRSTDNAGDIGTEDIVSGLAESAAEVVTSEGTNNEQETAAADASDSASVSDEGTQTETADSQNADKSASAASSTSAETPADEIVEPEIVAEEVKEPVQEVAPPVTEAPEEDDKVIDIVFMGDSQFDNGRNNGSSIPAYTCSFFDNVRFSNLAIGGTAASVDRGTSNVDENLTDTCFVGLCYALAGKLNDTSFLDKYPAGEELKEINPAKVDLYVIEYGANDYINGKDLWNPDSPFDTHSYKGALSVGVETLKSVSPNAKFLICSPSYCMWYNSDGYVIGDSYMVSKGIGTLSEYADICGNFADDEGYVYMDTMYATYFDLKITTVDDYLIDGLHYNEKGRQIYATVLSHFIKKTMGIDDSEQPYLEINDFEFKN